MSNAITKETQLLLTALKEHEELLADLYRAYGEKFSEDRSFWMELAAEEVDHASWLEDLQDQIADCTDTMLVERFPVSAVETSMEYVRKQIDRVADAELTARKAFSIAIDLEAALIENKFFEVLEGDHPRVKQVLLLLTQSTKEHFEMIRNAMSEAETS